MTALASLPVHRRVDEIEEALSIALDKGDFEIVHHEGERFLRPVLAGHVDAEAVNSTPLLSLHEIARHLERLLS